MRLLQFVFLILSINLIVDKASGQDGLSNLKSNSKFAPTKGTVNNLVVFIRFKDQTEFTNPMAFYDTLFNASSTYSLKGYYSEISNNQLNINSSFFNTNGLYPISYQDSFPRSYYQSNTVDGYHVDSIRQVREQVLIQNAVSYISKNVPKSLLIDANNDGLIDNISFIFRGGVDNSNANVNLTEGFGSILWPHRMTNTFTLSSINGKVLSTYQMLPDSGFLLSLICHEFFHNMGAPDIYRYQAYTLHTTGYWDLMGDKQSNPPQHPLVYMKQKYGKWVNNLITINKPGRYYLLPVGKNPFNAFKIAIPNSYTEYLMVEYRKKFYSTYERKEVNSGMIIYRVNPNLIGNAYGPPDEVYVYRPDGTETIDGRYTQSAFSKDSGRVIFDDVSNPSCFLSDGSPCGFASGTGITNVSSLGDTLYFDFMGGSANPAIVGLLTSPTNAFMDENTFISASIFDAKPITNAILHWGFAKTLLTNTIPMNLIGGNSYTSAKAIPKQQAGTTIYYSISAIDNINNSGGSDTLSYTVKQNNISYCLPDTASKFSFISNVHLNTINNQSSFDFPYGMFTNRSTYIRSDTVNNLSVAVSLGDSLNHFIKVWIDWNKDGIFADDELIANGTTKLIKDTLSLNINVPIDTYIGTTRMRIGLGNNAGFLPCNGNHFFDGEFEDYAITTSPSLSIGRINLAAQTIELFPNPSNGDLIVSFFNPIEETGKILVYNLLGEMVYCQSISIHNGTNREEIHLGDLNNGFYFLNLETSTLNTVKRVVISK